MTSTSVLQHATVAWHCYSDDYKPTSPPPWRNWSHQRQVADLTSCPSGLPLSPFSVSHKSKWLSFIPLTHSDGKSFACWLSALSGSCWSPKSPARKKRMANLNPGFVYLEGSPVDCNKVNFKGMVLKVYSLHVSKIIAFCNVSLMRPLLPCLVDRGVLWSSTRAEQKFLRWHSSPLREQFFLFQTDIFPSKEGNFTDPPRLNILHHFLSACGTHNKTGSGALWSVQNDGQAAVVAAAKANKTSGKEGSICTFCYDEFHPWESVGELLLSLDKFGEMVQPL